MKRINPNNIIKGELCPICGKGPKLEQWNICSYCGWMSDKVDEEYRDEPGGNHISFNKYKKEYERRIEINPKYIWKKYWYSKRGY